MSKLRNSSRRDFLRWASAGTVAASVAPIVLPGRTAHAAAAFSANDKINIGCIGMGIQAFSDLRAALAVPGTKLVAACDLYDGRLERAREVFGKDLFTTKDYREVLSRQDVDMVIVVVPDHWHQTIAIDALKAGKHVYCEKPMVQKIEQGEALIQAVKESGKCFQVGSQPVSSTVTEKARQLFKQGAIGKLNMVDILISRNSANGAWQYPIPTDASPETIDWDTFVEPTNKIGFDADRFFRWRKYWDYGTGVAGDMYVHRFTSLHRIIESIGPVKGMATGGVRFWTGKREAPDMILDLYEYPECETHPEFTLQLGANFADGGHGNTFQLIGDEGIMEIGYGVKVTRNLRPKETEEMAKRALYNYSTAEQERWMAQWRKEHAGQTERAKSNLSGNIEYVPPRGYDSHTDHFLVLYNAMRGNGEILEDAEYGLRAAAPALMANLCYTEDKIIKWDPKAMKLVG